MSIFAGKRDIWIAVAGPHFPDRSDEQLMALGMSAASDWFLGNSTPLTEMFDQYVMLKNLTGEPHGHQEDCS